MFKTVVFLALIAKISAIITPVIILDDGMLDGVVQLSFNPFAKTSIGEFENIVNVVLERSSKLIFFIEEAFSVEDVSLRDYKGTSYHHLLASYQDKKLKYYPKVMDAYTFLRKRFESFEFNTFRLRSTTTRLRLDENYKFLYVYFDDGVNDSRVEALRRHDVIMKEVYFAVQQLSSGPVAAIYTGKANPVARRADFPTAAPVVAIDKEWHTVVCAGAIDATFRFFDTRLQNGIKEILIPRKCVYTQTSQYNYDIFMYDVEFESQLRVGEDRVHRIRFTFQVQVDMKAGWKLIEIKLLNKNAEAIFTQPLNIKHSWNTFYNSDKPLIIADPLKWYDPKVNISKFQVKISAPPTLLRQGISDNSTQTQTKIAWTSFQNKYLDVAPIQSTRKAADHNRDVLTSIPILTGHFVAVILLSILFWGVYMMMNCYSNDKLDSPDSKPLIQASAE